MSLTFSFTFLDFLAFKHAECPLKRFKRPADYMLLKQTIVVKLIYTGLVKYVILPTQIMCAFVRLRLVEKLTRPTQNPSCLSRTGQGTNATPFKF